MGHAHPREGCRAAQPEDLCADEQPGAASKPAAPVKLESSSTSLRGSEAQAAYGPDLFSYLQAMRSIYDVGAEAL